QRLDGQGYTQACTLTRCFNGGTCLSLKAINDDIVSVTDYCKCPVGFAGKYCENFILANRYQRLRHNRNQRLKRQIEIPAGNPCESFPCQNEGTCRWEFEIIGGQYNFKDEYTCICHPGYSGTHCELDSNVSDPCDSSPCTNGGTCASSSGGTSFSCSCPTSHTGDLCELESPCHPNPCENSGACTVDWIVRQKRDVEEIPRGPDDVYNFTCQCTDGYSGAKCDITDDPCTSNPCQNGATCVVEAGKRKKRGVQEMQRRSGDFDDWDWDWADIYVCECEQGFHGVNCEEGAAIINCPN
ncbi:unnamed protein product, partial [Owenia fusiformis]